MKLWFGQVQYEQLRTTDHFGLQLQRLGSLSFASLPVLPVTSSSRPLSETRHAVYSDTRLSLSMAEVHY